MQNKEGLLNLEELKKTALRRVHQELKKIQARLALHEAEYEESLHYKRFEYLAELVQAHFPLLKKGMDRIEVEDFEKGGEKVTVLLNPSLAPKEMVASLFKRVRKMKRRLFFCEKWLKELKIKLEEWEGLKEEIGSIETKEAWDLFIKVHPLLAPYQIKKEKVKKERSCFREFMTVAGFKILVGKNDRDNDQLSFQIAKGNDLWLHAAHFSGSHVVVQNKKGKEVDQESLQDAMQLALHFSKAKDEKMEEVTITQCKYLSKPKGGAPGKVLLSRHKNRMVRKDEKRLDRLLKRVRLDGLSPPS